MIPDNIWEPLLVASCNPDQPRGLFLSFLIPNVREKNPFMLLSVPQMNQPPVSLWRSLDWPATLEQQLRILESVILYMLGGTVEPQVLSMLHFYAVCWQSQTAKRVFLTSPALGHPKNLGPFWEDSQHRVPVSLCITFCESSRLWPT
jgi:hypothetical protein